MAYATASPEKVTNVSNGTIRIRSGDITQETVDAVAIASTSDNLRSYVLQQAGDPIETAYETERKQEPNAPICTVGGNLSCKRIYFIPCPKLCKNADKSIFRKFVSEAFQLAANDSTTEIQSIALPAIGSGKYGCDINFVAKTLIRAVAYELEHQPSLCFNIYFLIRRKNKEIFNAFTREIRALSHGGLCKKNMPSSKNMIKPAPPRLLKTPTARRRSFAEQRLLDKSSNEYTQVLKKFTATMTSDLYTQIIRIELVWNECLYKQYQIQKDTFFHRLNKDTEQDLFHGCSEDAANSIIKGWFNRGYAGQHGVAYGHGAYFSSKASYSHGYATPNSNGERCMFLAKVLIGNTTHGDSSMKVCPSGYDSTTDGSHIYVVYHDTQAFGKYLITYK